MAAASLRRRGPMNYVHLSTDLFGSRQIWKWVADQSLVRTLALPYSRDARIAGGFDRNLRGERWEEALKRIEITDWADVVFRAKNAGFDTIRYSEIADCFKFIFGKSRTIP